MNKLQAGSKGLRKYTLYWPLFFLGPFIICFLAFNLFPILFTLRTSFFEWDGMADKVFVGLANYKRVLLEDANCIYAEDHAAFVSHIHFSGAVDGGVSE